MTLQHFRNQTIIIIVIITKNITNYNNQNNI